MTVKNNIHQAINSDYNISQNYPNPFNPTTNIVYHLSEKGFVDISVYDLLGHKIATLINGYKNEGSYKIKFDGSKLSSGIYYYVFSNNKSRISNKMLLIK
ncbi:MAG: T9SS type A sorting domain-containing protein [Ignavibacteriae bacterium]|nr:T9SS type A sorting domain-containing protein [Ignavibacteriota bacterium]